MPDTQRLASVSVLGRMRRSAEAFTHLLTRLAADDEGQDLIEYAFLACFIGATSYLALNGIRGAVASTYQSWLNPDYGVPSAWNPPEPPAPPPGP